MEVKKKRWLVVEAIQKMVVGGGGNTKNGGWWWRYVAPWPMGDWGRRDLAPFIHFLPSPGLHFHEHVLFYFWLPAAASKQLLEPATGDEPKDSCVLGW